MQRLATNFRRGFLPGRSGRSPARSARIPPMTADIQDCPEALWREAERVGVFAGRRSTSGRLHPFLDRRPGARDRARHFAGQDGLLLVAVDAEPSATACARSPRAEASCSRTSMGRCRLTAVRWVRPLPLGPDGHHVFPELG